MPDVLDDLMEELRNFRRPDMPLWISAAAVFHNGLQRDSITSIDLEAFAAAGYKAVADAGGWPADATDLLDLSVPGALELIKRGEEFDLKLLAGVEASKLAFIGFMTLAAELLMDADSLN